MEQLRFEEGVLLAQATQLVVRWNKDETLTVTPESVPVISASLVFHVLAFLNVVTVGKKAGSNLRWGEGQGIKESTGEPK